MTAAALFVEVVPFTAPPPGWGRIKLSSGEVKSVRAAKDQWAELRKIVTAEDKV